MKGFVRENQLLSLCGLNCGLCTMRLGGHCGGCGNGNQTCPIARCSLAHGGVSYCFACAKYPCERCQGDGEYDVFITRQRRIADLEKAKEIGIEAYNEEQRRKVEILEALLSRYNDGRRKTFFSVAVNLLELPELEQSLARIEKWDTIPDRPLKERSAYAAEVLKETAEKRGLELKLRKKTAGTKDKK